jgi:hypothetical protein
VVDVGRDVAGRVTERTYGNGVERSMVYDTVTGAVAEVAASGVMQTLVTPDLPSRE